MESLSPGCTREKQRYDACFNSWFEGYLQPALDSSRSSFAIPSYVSQETPSFASSSSTSIPSESIPELAVHQPLITSWASAFRRRYPPSGSRSDLSETPAGEGTRSDAVESPVEATPVETAGKTRAQIKAAQYEKGCGEVWKTYQKCLKKAILADRSLSTLLEQARDEHPLHRQGGLEGSFWDPQTEPRQD